MTWERFRCQTDCTRDDCINEKLIRQHADILSQPRVVNIDDCWAHMERNAAGLLEGNSSRFPHGMKPLADDLHSKNAMTWEHAGAIPANARTRTARYRLHDGRCADLRQLGGRFAQDGCCNSAPHNHAVLDRGYVFLGEQPTPARGRTRPPTSAGCTVRRTSGSSPAPTTIWPSCSGIEVSVATPDGSL